jgi:NtrC-family two-component system response regulator AlgB
MAARDPAAGVSSTPLAVLIVDDEPNIRRMMALHLEGRGHQVRTVATPAEALREAAARSFDVAFVDLRLGADSGLDLLTPLLAQAPDLKVVVITAYASVETAVEAMRRGAKDYLPKPFNPAELDLAVAKVTGLGRLEQRVRTLERGLSKGAAEPQGSEPQQELESASAAMHTIIALARQVAETEARVLLRGESGTGKGLVARAIHAWSARRDKPFVTISCPVLPAELLESELFGHVRGAFTGASRDNPGRVAVAEGGTLLLDEIGDLPPGLQPKLLRFIQDREYERVGDPLTRTADVRILAATNRDLEAAVREGRFREDLLYRLNVITLDIPPLRERPEDVLPLAERFLEHFGREYRKPDLRFSADALRALLAHGWPGNVRELRNVVERATMLTRDRDVEPELLLLPGPRRPEGSAVAVGDLVPLSDIEQEHIRRVLARTTSLKEAAAILGVDQATLWRRRKQYGI